MNERIQELYSTVLHESAERWNHPDAEKFAQLIVQECCNVARRTILVGSGVNPNTFAGTVTAVQEIKKHFGVEE